MTLNYIRPVILDTEYGIKKQGDDTITEEIKKVDNLQEFDIIKNNQIWVCSFANEIHPDDNTLVYELHYDIYDDEGTKLDEVIITEGWKYSSDGKNMKLNFVQKILNDE